MSKTSNTTNAGGDAGNDDTMMSKEQLEDVLNRLLQGLQVFVRDTNLPEAVASKYHAGLLLREPTLCDATRRIGGMATSHRFCILSNHFKDLSAFEMGTNYGLSVCSPGSYFVVLDVYELEDKTQITLLHLDENWELFKRIQFTLEDTVSQCRELFDAKHNVEAAPELADEEWLARVASPIGMNEAGEAFPLEESPSAGGVAKGKGGEGSISASTAGNKGGGKAAVSSDVGNKSVSIMDIFKKIFAIIPLLIACGVIIKFFHYKLENRKIAAMMTQSKNSVVEHIEQDSAKRRSIESFRKKAEEGDAEAQYNLGVLYYKGEGVEKNKAEAIKWLSMAVERGHEKAAKMLEEIK